MKFVHLSCCDGVDIFSMELEMLEDGPLFSVYKLTPDGLKILCDSHAHDLRIDVGKFLLGSNLYDEVN